MLKRFALIIILVLMFFYQLAFTDLILARGDTYTYFYPYWDARDAALAQGELPLWTNELYMGAPLLANPQLGTLYPPNWLTISLPAPDAVRISILLHVAWALLGMVLLARRELAFFPALIAGCIFAFGGYLGSHVEQINQLQGLVWMPWLFLLFALSLEKSLWYVPLLALAWGMQLLSGHTQTVFISGVGLGVYAILTPPGRYSSATLPRFGEGKSAIHNDSVNFEESGEKSPLTLNPGQGGWGIGVKLLILAMTALLGVVIASPQLIPTQALISLSNRGGGLTQQQATAFSLNPFLVGRGLLPSYDAQPFGEYVGYIGIIGMGLAIIGAFSRRKWTWITLVVVGLLLAFGRHNLLYLLLAELPGFNLFRVPARWLALTTFGAALLAGHGLQALQDNHQRRRTFAAFVIVVAVLAGLSLLSNQAADEVDGSALPTLLTWAGWFMALGTFSALYWWRRSRVLFGVLVLVELWVAAQYLPYNDLTDPAVYNDSRLTINQMKAFTQDELVPGRFLSISNLLFDPGDRPALEARWAQMGISDRAARYAFTATKMQETIAPNLPLTWGISSVDGFGGGVLPTTYYTAFTSLLLPENTLRTIDGRLREVLAKCRGACLPADKWLDLMNVQYLLTDKVYDLTRDGIFYDTQFQLPIAADDTLTLDTLPNFQTDSLHLLYRCNSSVCFPPIAEFFYDEHPSIMLQSNEGDQPDEIEGFSLVRLIAPEALTPQSLQITAESDITLIAMTLVDTRTDDFVQITPPGWQRVYSADVKIYKNLDVMPRAFVVHQAATVPDTWDGTEQALTLMQATDFDPAQTVILHTDALEELPQPVTPPQSTVRIIEYTSTRAVIEVESSAPGFLVMTDAFYPGWHVEDGRPIYRADVMFRAIPIEARLQTLVLTFSL